MLSTTEHMSSCSLSPPQFGPQQRPLHGLPQQAPYMLIVPKALTTALLFGIVLATGCAGSPPPKLSTLAPNERHVGIAMLGRSVTEQWFAYWGARPNTGHQRGRFRLLHRAFTEYSPSREAWTAQADRLLTRFGARLDALHYKLCFVDFTSGTKLAPLREIAEGMYEVVVKKHGKRLIIGTALPAVLDASPKAVRELHYRYNQWLRRFAAAHPKVLIFDQYRILANAEGLLKLAFRQGPQDSHLQPGAYRELTHAYFRFLERHFPPGYTLRRSAPSAQSK